MKRLARNIRAHWQLYVFILPAFVYVLVFSYYPMFGAQIAFRDYVPGNTAATGIWNSPWVGFKHFRNFFTSFHFSRLLRNTLSLSLYSLALNFPLSIIAALALNIVRSGRYKKLVQTITYMPHFISVTVLIGIVSQLLNPVIGVYGNLHRLLHGSGYPSAVMGRADAFRHIYVWSEVWQNLGWSTITYIAALSGVDPQLHEAAEIDGATRWKRVLHIDLPVLLPTVAILLILNVGSFMSVGAEKVLLLQSGTNLTASEIISTYVYKEGLKKGVRGYSYASAVGLFNSVVNCTLLLLVNRISTRLSSGDFGLF